MTHIPSPDHWPGSLYGCPACEESCCCDDSLQLPAGETVPCLHCELEEEREEALEDAYLAGDDR